MKRPAPDFLPDADDTAKSILMLNLCGHRVTPDQMLSHFKISEGHVQTFFGERNASFSTNCHVLMALLNAPEPQRYSDQIERIAEYLCDCWSSGPVKDKWNTSFHYPKMLLAQAMMQLMRLWDSCLLKLSSRDLIQLRVCRILIQILNRTLFSQNRKGTWSSEDPSESDAYCLLTLLALDGLPLVALLAMKVRSAIQTGRQALLLSESKWGKPQRIWVGKTMYGSCTLTESYCLAAMNAPFSTHRWEDNVKAIMGPYTRNVLQLCRFFSSLPEYSTDPQWMILASILEGFSFFPQLKDVKSEVFPHQDGAEDIYLDIPQLIAYTVPTGTDDQESKASDKPQNEDSRSLPAVEQVLGRYITAVLLHGRIQAASSSDRSSLRTELQTFLGAHIEQLQDNVGFHHQILTSQVPTKRWNAPRTSHYTWGHTTAASHTSCPFAFRFYTCLIGHRSSDAFFPSADVFDSGYTKYLAEDVSSHIAVMIRLSNDYGSIARDEGECNINSVNFPEFQGCTELNTDSTLDEAYAGKQQTRQAKDQLLRLVQYERRCVDEACKALFENLESTSKKARNTRDAVELFLGVAKMYADLYEARDITNRVK
ncbi:MAG: hypothetical protein LQ350_001486 [Teloschistes chrysophthalmus]|nr:MAG: hypothetical protein LQ350_001486 [Niorma chrysophthalma]